MLTRLSMLLSAVVALTLVGCTTVREAYPGHEPSQVWAAMIASANNPGYHHDWFTVHNHVHADEADARIELHRQIRRDVIIPLGNPQRQERTLQHTIRLVEGKQGPTIEIVSRAVDVPAQAREDARLYFADVWALLGGKPMTAPDASPTGASGGADRTPKEATESSDGAPSVDVDDLRR